MILNNLLNQALSVIPSQCGELHRHVGRSQNSIGEWVDQYAAPIPIEGSFQAVPRNLFERMGLDYKKTYYMIFTSDDVKGLSVDSSGDRISYAGSMFKAQTEGGWKPVDGWSGILIVKIPND